MRRLPYLDVCACKILLTLHVERAFRLRLAFNTSQMGDEFGDLALALQVFDIFLMRSLQVLTPLFFGFGELCIVPFRYSRLRLPVVLVTHRFLLFFLALFGKFSHGSRIFRLCKSFIVVQDFGIHSLRLVDYLCQCRPLFFRCLPRHGFGVFVELLVQDVNGLLRYARFLDLVDLLSLVLYVLLDFLYILHVRRIFHSADAICHSLKEAHGIFLPLFELPRRFLRLSCGFGFLTRAAAPLRHGAPACRLSKRAVALHRPEVTLCFRHGDGLHAARGLTAVDHAIAHVDADVPGKIHEVARLRLVAAARAVIRSRRAEGGVVNDALCILPANAVYACIGVDVRRVAVALDSGIVCDIAHPLFALRMTCSNVRNECADGIFYVVVRWSRGGAFFCRTTSSAASAIVQKRQHFFLLFFYLFIGLVFGLALQFRLRLRVIAMQPFIIRLWAVCIFPPSFTLLFCRKRIVAISSIGRGRHTFRRIINFISRAG